MLNVQESQDQQTLAFKNIGIASAQEYIVYLHERSPLLVENGFSVGMRLRVESQNKHLLATLHVVQTSSLQHDEVSLSESAQKKLGVKPGVSVTLSYPEPLKSWSYIQDKIRGKKFDAQALATIMREVVDERLLRIHIAAFLTACMACKMSEQEITYMTQAMVDVGQRIQWPYDLVVDKHCVGGLSGNRTTLIVIPIVAAFGLVIPKSSSRSITSSAGTADTMEVLAPVNLSFEQIQRAVQKEKGCIVWGGATHLSPADDILINVQRILNIDGPTQFVTSILSKKIAAGSTHLLLDIPVGETAKVKTMKEAKHLKKLLQHVGKKLGLMVKVVISDGSQPVGYGIGPALEARDVLAVLKNEPQANPALRKHAIELAGLILEFSPNVKKGKGRDIAEKILTSGDAWKKFQAICEAQGGMKKTVPVAQFQKAYCALKTGKVKKINNLYLAKAAKLAGAPMDPAAGVDVHVFLGDRVKQGQPLFTVHSETEGELAHTFEYLQENPDIYQVVKR